MGVFTVFCVVCGGPPNDVSNWVEDLKEEGELDNFDFTEAQGKWLDDCRGLCRKRVDATKEGAYNSYGELEIDGEDNVCVCRLNWEDDRENAVLIHSYCYERLQQVLPGVSAQQFFKFFEPIIEECGYSCSGYLDYGAIQKNWGQDYEMHGGEAWLVHKPNLPEPNVTSVPAVTPISSTESCGDGFCTLPKELLPFPLTYLSAQDLNTMQLVSKAWNGLAQADALWKGFAETLWGADQLKDISHKVPQNGWKGYVKQLMEDPSALSARRFQHTLMQIKNLYHQWEQGTPVPDVDYPVPAWQKKRVSKDEDDDASDDDGDDKDGSGDEDSSEDDAVSDDSDNEEDAEGEGKSISDKATKKKTPATKRKRQEGETKASDNDAEEESSDSDSEKEDDNSENDDEDDDEEKDASNATKQKQQQKRKKPRVG